MYEKMTANISMFINQNYKGNIVISKVNIDKYHTTKKSGRLGMAGDTDLPWDSWKHQTELLGDFTTLSRETGSASCRAETNSSSLGICSLCLFSRCRVQLSGTVLTYCENISNMPIQILSLRKTLQVSILALHIFSRRSLALQKQVNRKFIYVSNIKKKFM